MWCSFSQTFSKRTSSIGPEKFSPTSTDIIWPFPSICHKNPFWTGAQTLFHIYPCLLNFIAKMLLYEKESYKRGMEVIRGCWNKFFPQIQCFQFMCPSLSKCISSGLTQGWFILYGAGGINWDYTTLEGDATFARMQNTRHMYYIRKVKWKEEQSLKFGDCTSPVQNS